MNTPVFDVILVQKEWAILKALHEIGSPATARAIHEGLSKIQISSNLTLQILRRLHSCRLVTRQEVFTQESYGPVRHLLWDISLEGQKFF